MKQRITTALSLLALVLAGCTERVIDPPNSAGEIPFGLTIPETRPAGDYYLVSGVFTEVRSVKIGDSLELRDIQNYSAQFNRANPVLPMPMTVHINGDALSRHRGGDTLRLRGVSDTSLLSVNTWKIVDSTGAEGSYTTPVIDVVDSVLPFRGLLPNQILRADSSLTIRWKRPSRPSGGLAIEWRGVNDTLRVNANDGFGFHTFTADEMKRVRGAGTVVITRFHNTSGTFQGLRVVATRLAQRSYEVSVQ